MNDQDEILMIARTVEDIERVLVYLDNPEFDLVAYDSETTGLEDDCEVVGFSICAEDNVGIYITFAEWVPDNRESDCEVCCGVGSIDMGMTKAGKPKKRKKCKACKTTGKILITDGQLVRYPELKEASRPIFDWLLKRRLIMHNSPFDIRVTRSEMGVDLMPALHTDNMEMWHLLDENESCGLKEIAARLYGDDATKEKAEMKASVLANGGRWEESKKPGSKKEMYKADLEIFGRYGAKDTVLTRREFYDGVVRLFDEGLDKFFYEDESMPLMKTVTYDLNTIGLKVDVAKLKQLKAEMTDTCTRLKREVEELIAPLTSEKYPKGFGAKIKDAFNINSPSQLAWLLFTRQEEYFLSLTKSGKALAKELVGRVPYTNSAKRALVEALQDSGKDPWKYMQCDAAALEHYEKKYPWCAKMLEFRSELKLLKTYVTGIELRLQYGVIHPGFLQHGTVTGRLSSSNPNFQNLPREDKRIKSMIIPRPGKIFVGADFSQLEPRVFASESQDPDLMNCFALGQDFYSVVGAPIFGYEECSLFKDDEGSFAKAHKTERQMSKAFALATPYGTSAFQQSQKLKMPQKECQEIIDNYLARYSSVHQMMLRRYEEVKDNGVVYSMFGRPRRIPDGKLIRKYYGDADHADLPYEARTLLNTGVNFPIQSAGASIINRAAIAFHKRMEVLGLNAKIVMQVHDELIVECDLADVDVVSYELKHAMETTTVLPGVKLEAQPQAGMTLAEAKAA